MGFFTVFSIALGLAMDSFSVSICKGLSLKKLSAKPCFIAGAWFGGFQGGMTLIGWLLGSSFKSFIEAVDHWIAFALLLLIGGNMIKEALEDMREDRSCLDGTGSCKIEPDPMNAKSMFGFAVATSIDALAIGVTLSFWDVNILVACLTIGLVAFVCSAVGIVIGSVFGQKYRSRAEIVGGCILVFLGVQILLRDLGIFG